jgi:hypothetical protein
VHIEGEKVTKDLEMKDELTGLNRGDFTVCDKTTEKWPKLNLKDMQFHVEKALRAKKYLLIWDRVGTTSAFFKAMEVIIDAGA